VGAPVTLPVILLGSVLIVASSPVWGVVALVKRRG
jgi:hypothetical protein